MENRIEKSKQPEKISGRQILDIMDRIAAMLGAITIKKQLDSDEKITLWEIKVPVAKGGTKIYTYQKKANNGKGILMAYFSNNNNKRNITRAEMIAEEVDNNTWVVYSDGESIERK